MAVMMISKMSLSRRTVLRGLGCTLALPLLDAMVPALSAMNKTAATPARRFGVVYVPNGMAMDYYLPKAVGADYDVTPILAPLAPFRDQTLILSGLHGYWDATHAGACTSFLTASAGRRGEMGIRADVSIDQVMAREFGKQTQLASLELAMDSKSNAGQCSAGYSCVYTNTLSWRSATTPVAGESNPRIVFERMFGDEGSTDSAARLAGARKDRSVLDSVTEKVAALQRRVGPGDRGKIDEYMEGVRDVERRVQKAEEQSDLELPVVEQPSGIPATFGEHARLMYDLQRLAYQADLTRVITIMMGREESSRTYAEIGVPDAHHPLSHHRYDPARIATMSKINLFHTRLFAEYLGKLRATPDGDGSLLDHMLIMYGAGMSDSNAHAHNNLPILLVGGGSGQLKGGRHLHYSNDMPSANLLVTVMDKLGVPVDHVGHSNGKLDIDTLSLA
jgi:uncharacterized protein DUF1552